MNGFFKVCEGVLPKTRHYNTDFAAWQMWSDQLWYNHPGRSITEQCLHVQYRLGQDDMQILSTQESLFSRDQNKTEKFLLKKYLCGSFLPLPLVPLLSNSLPRSHCCRSKLRCALACRISTDHVQTWIKTLPDYNKHLTLSPRHGLDWQILSC